MLRSFADSVGERGMNPLLLVYFPLLYFFAYALDINRHRRTRVSRIG